MSGKGKKHSKRNNPKSLGDVTLNDFANATVCKSRLKKSSANAPVDDRAWDEKIEEFDGDFDFVEEQNEDGTTSIVIKKQEVQSRTRKTTEVYKDGVDYHIDIWFLISEYIKPEEVGKFGAICKTSFEVICSAKFWFGMYRRYYKNVPNLPERLQPECMVRLYGLRACVIRALHHFYEPFVTHRLSSELVSFNYEQHPQNLQKRQCVLVWHRKVKNVWLYFFKLKENKINFHPRPKPSHQPDLIEMLEDVSANTEEHCRILEVASPHFVSIPPVMGYSLFAVSIKLCQNFRNYRLHLGFASGVGCGPRPLDGTDVILDPVTHLSVLDWWHPRYPHHRTTPVLNHD